MITLLVAWLGLSALLTVWIMHRFTVEEARRRWRRTLAGRVQRLAPALATVGAAFSPLEVAAARAAIQMEKVGAGKARQGGDMSEQQQEPTTLGWYTYSGGRQVMIFHRRESGQWSAHFDNGTANDCAWGYIEQALGVWDLVPLVPEIQP